MQPARHHTRVLRLSHSRLQTFELDEAAQRRVMKRSSWLQAYCRYRSRLTQHGIHRVDSGELSRDWQKAFETIAKTWGRLLSLVGLRR